MGTVGAARRWARNGRQRGPRALGVAVVALLLVRPRAGRLGRASRSRCWRPPGSCSWRRPGATRWRGGCPRWVAEAIAVPVAAQLACTPVVAALSGQVSLVAVVANLLAAPAVAPATVLGLLGGLVGLVWAGRGPAARLAAPAWCVAWIVAVAQHGARPAPAAIDWGTGAAGARGADGARRRDRAGRAAACCVARRPGSAAACSWSWWCWCGCRRPGWPPRGLGARRLRRRPGRRPGGPRRPGQRGRGGRRPRPGAGRPLPRPARGRATCRCWCSPTSTPTTSTGWPGCLDGRRVGEPSRPRGCGTRPRGGPRSWRRPVTRWRRRTAVDPAGRRGHAPGAVAAAGRRPTPGPRRRQPANDASVVLLVEVRGVRILLTGDVEPEAQVALARAWPGLRVDVLKVPHHGSRYQDLDFLRGLRRAGRAGLGRARTTTTGTRPPETLDRAGGDRRRGLPDRPRRRPSRSSRSTG